MGSACNTAKEHQLALRFLEQFSGSALSQLYSPAELTHFQEANWGRGNPIVAETFLAIA